MTENYWKISILTYLTVCFSTGLCITDGYKAVSYQFPWHAFIQAHLPEGVRNCNGLLLSNRTVLTAANCLEGASLAIIGLGSTNKYTPLINLRSKSFHFHPDYNRVNYTNNLCIINLPLPLSLVGNNNIKAVQLPFNHSAETSYEGLHGYISGYGRTSMTSNASDFLLYGKVQVIPFRDCSNHFGRDKISPNNVCTLGSFGSNQGACISDWGAPLIIKEKLENILIGITSFISEKACGRDEPSAFTKIHPYIHWIMDQIKVL